MKGTNGWSGFVLFLLLFTCSGNAFSGVSYSKTNDAQLACVQMDIPATQLSSCNAYFSGSTKYYRYADSGIGYTSPNFGPVDSSSSSCGFSGLTDQQALDQCNNDRNGYLNNHYACSIPAEQLNVVRRVATSNPAQTNESCSNMQLVSGSAALRDIWACWANTPEPVWLAALSTHRVAVSNDTEAGKFILAFDLPHATATAFTDRPYRRSERLELTRFLQDWNSLFSAPPNAEIALGDEDYVEGVITQQWTNNVEGKFYIKFTKDSGEPNLRLGGHISSHVFIDQVDNFSSRYAFDDNLPTGHPLTLGGKTDDPESLLFAFSGEKAQIHLAKDIGMAGNLATGKLVMFNPSILTHAFKAHPQRGSASLTTEHFLIAAWPHLFGGVPPNAVISGNTPSGEIQDFVVTLSNPYYESSGRIVFDVVLLDSHYSLSELSNVHVYVDSFWGFLEGVGLFATAAVSCGITPYAIAATIQACATVATCPVAVAFTVLTGSICIASLTALFDHLGITGSPTLISDPAAIDPFNPANYPAGLKDKSWSISSNNYLVNNQGNHAWLLTTPSVADGLVYSNWAQPVICTSDTSTDSATGCNRSKGVNTQFLRQKCSVNADCKPTQGVGQCAAVASTVKSSAETAQKLCTGHSDKIADTYYNTIIKAEKYVDLSHLGQLYPGPWNAAIQNAVAYVSNKPASTRPIIRAFMGVTIGDTGFIPKWYRNCRINVENELTNLMSAVPESKKSGLKLFVAYGITDMMTQSWNHSKILSVDGKYLITGGHNWLSDRYLETLPVFDMSLQMKGDAADTAHKFLNQMWQYHIDNFTQNSSSYLSNDWCQRQIAYSPSVDAEYNKQNFLYLYTPYSPSHKLALTSGEMSSSTNHVNVKTLAMANLAAIDYSGNTIEHAISLMLKGSQSTVYISQQDLGPYPVNLPIVQDYFPDHKWEFSGWPTAFFVDLGLAMKRGVKAHIVLSTPGANNGYSNNYSLMRVKGEALKAMESDGKIGSRQEIKELICDNLSLYNIRYSRTDNAYENAGYGVPNHSKSIMVDKKWILIGSHNLYRHNLQEYAVLMSSANVGQDQYNYYWKNLLYQSVPTCISGADCTAYASRSTCLNDNAWN